MNISLCGQTLYLHLGLDVSSDFVRLGSKLGSQFVIGILFVKLIL